MRITLFYFSDHFSMHFAALNFFPYFLSALFSPTRFICGNSRKLRKNAGLKRLCNRLNMQKKAGKEKNPDRKCEYRQLLLKYVTFLPIRSGKVGGEEKIEKIFSVTT